jgi:type I restriction enzyme S subunit
MRVASPGDRYVPWLPTLADAIPLKYICSLNQATLPDDTPDDLEIRYIDISAVDELGYCGDPQPMEFGKAPSRARRVVRDGDILVATVRHPHRRRQVSDRLRPAAPPDHVR